MAISFIITTYNILPYIERCLQSVAQASRPGDEIILVDDGSDDGTAERVQAFADEGHFPDDVDFRPIYLGTNTIGGVGIGANIGLNAARCETIFFVDGDDWIDVAGFRKARAYWHLHPADILFTNYLEFNETKRVTQYPADARRWENRAANLSIEMVRHQALSFIAVPWRKFYRRDFLEEHGLRFLEGDFFFEDNPFHWAICMKARSIRFLDQVTCYHRVNRPGQTMASTGIELTAFFSHFISILDGLAPDDHRHRLLAAQWLLSNMSWHIPRLAAEAFYPYASAAARTLQLIPENLWSGDLAAKESGKSIWTIANRLRSGDVSGQMTDWHRQAMEQKMAGLSARLKALEAQNRALTETIKGLTAANAFDVIHARHISDK